jgi:hypothetical protein
MMFDYAVNPNRPRPLQTFNLAQLPAELHTDTPILAFFEYFSSVKIIKKIAI